MPLRWKHVIDAQIPWGPVAAGGSVAPPSDKPHFDYFYTAPVNTGVDSGLDLNGNGTLGEADDRWGYGAFEGQYGMVLLSRYPILDKDVRTFQKFRWSAMPSAKRPATTNPGSADTVPYHNDGIWKELRLSSKSHWIVPIAVGDRRIHILASHPTPPVFDGPEDRNGLRNHDEIRMLVDLIAGDADYLIDDAGLAGGLNKDARFVIMGDLNADPLDGDGSHEIIQQLLGHPRVAQYQAPRSQGGAEAAKLTGQANVDHRGDPASDTGDFNDKAPGNLRVDYVLPSSELQVVDCGVYWPSTSESEEGNRLVQASDHRLVWVDIRLN